MPNRPRSHISWSTAIVLTIAFGWAAKAFPAVAAGTEPASKPAPTRLDFPSNWSAFDDRGGMVMLVDERNANVYDVTTSKRLAGPLPFEGDVALSRDGKMVAAGSTGKFGKWAVKLWNLPTGRAANTWEVDTQVWHLSFNPDSTRLLASGPAADSRIWDVRTGRPLVTLAGDRGARSAYFDPTGRTVITMGDRAVYLWDSATGNRTAGPLPCDADIGPAAFGPDGNRLALPRGNNVSIVSVPGGRELTSIQTRSTVIGVNFSPDGDKVVACSTGRARVFAISNGHQFGKTIGNQSLFLTARFDATGRRLVVSAQVDESGVWDWESGKQVVKVQSTQWDMIPFLAASPSGTLLAVCEPEKTTTSFIPIPQGD